MNERNLLIFDGVCELCNASVNFIIKRDKRKKFVFSPMQSQFALKTMEDYQIPGLANDTFILIKNGDIYLRSDAALEIARELNGLWFVFYAFKILPRALRDPLYDFIARNRYKLFGRRDQCMLPSSELKGRFKFEIDR